MTFTITEIQTFICEGCGAESVFVDGETHTERWTDYDGTTTVHFCPECSGAGEAL